MQYTKEKKTIKYLFLQVVATSADSLNKRIQLYHDFCQCN